MKVYETTEIRNVALVGHGNSGKTALTGALLFTAGATPRQTRPDEGNTITDFDEEEIARKITISSAVAAIEWKGKKINLSEGADRFLGGWQLNANVTVMSGLPFNVSYRDAGAARDTGPSRPNLVGDAQTGSGDGLTSPYFNVAPIGSSGSAFSRPARGTFGDLERNARALLECIDQRIVDRVDLPAEIVELAFVVAHRGSGEAGDSAPRPFPSRARTA